MNILIVGNGFDLSHYLPTKYDHFMVAMGAVEKWDEANGDMGFDDLFGSLYEKEDYFFGYTKAIYRTDEIKISVDQIKMLSEQLKENVWYQYFSDHVREVKTWIDFETKINEALILLSVFFVNVRVVYEKSGDFNKDIFIGEIFEKQDYILTQRKFDILSVLGLFEKNINYGRAVSNAFGRDVKAGGFSRHCFIVPNDGKYGFNEPAYLQFLQESLEFFITLFNKYLERVISKLLSNYKPSIGSEDWIRPNKIYSFNYTDTFQRIYEAVDVEYLHGSHGENQNIVLGISDLQDESLKKIKAYGFTKYHQKIRKEISFKFLVDNKDIKDMVGSFWSKGKALSKKVRIENELNVIIWGHSFDESDASYIKEIFSFNSSRDENIRVKIYFFDDIAKNSIISNLLYILGRPQVEMWIRNEWLKFEKNPDIAKINNIKPVDLPKISAS